MKNLKNQPFACLMALLLSFVACNNSQKQLEEFSKEISNRCPIVINDAMSIVGSNTDDNQLVYKMLLNEELLDMGTIKTEEYKKLVAISVANQGLLSDNLIKNETSVLCSFTGSKSGVKYNVVLSPKDMETLNGTHVGMDMVYDEMLKSLVGIWKKKIPQKIDRGVDFSDIILNDTALIYVYHYSNQYDLNAIPQTKLKQLVVDMINYDGAGDFMQFRKVLINTNRGYVVRLTGGNSKGREVVFSKMDLMHWNQ